eukprot:1681745-Heterocapsa_arctica.AAC.1
MASQPSTSSGPTNAESPIAKRMAFPAFGGGEGVSIESSVAPQSSSLSATMILSSPTEDVIS